MGTKYYTVKTRKAYDALMKELEAKGYAWQSGAKPTTKDYYSDDEVVIAQEDGYLAHTDLTWFHKTQSDKVLVEYTVIPVIPQYVADWVKYCKAKDYSLHTAMNAHSFPREYSAYTWATVDTTPDCYTPMRTWLTDGEQYKEREELLAKAWLGECAVEKLYRVLLPQSDHPGAWEYKYLTADGLVTGTDKLGNVATLTKEFIESVDSRYMAFAEEVTD